MNQLVGTRATVLATLQSTITAFQNDGPVVQQVMNESLQPITEDQRQAVRARVIQELQKAYDEALATPDNGNFYMPQDPVIALFQTAREQHLGVTVDVRQNPGYRKRNLLELIFRLNGSASFNDRH